VAIVYHYTETQAFAGIVEKAALWATDFRYLNDSRELRYAWDEFVAKLRELSSAAVTSGRSDHGPACTNG
jgi:hypothetical protein